MHNNKSNLKFKQNLDFLTWFKLRISLENISAYEKRTIKQDVYILV